MAQGLSFPPPLCQRTAIAHLTPDKPRIANRGEIAFRSGDVLLVIESDAV